MKYSAFSESARICLLLGDVKQIMERYSWEHLEKRYKTPEEIAHLRDILLSIGDLIVEDFALMANLQLKNKE